MNSILKESIPAIFIERWDTYHSSWNKGTGAKSANVPKTTGGQGRGRGQPFKLLGFLPITSMNLSSPLLDP